VASIAAHGHSILLLMITLQASFLATTQVRLLPRGLPTDRAVAWFAGIRRKRKCDGAGRGGAGGQVETPSSRILSCSCLSSVPGRCGSVTLSTPRTTRTASSSEWTRTTSRLARSAATWCRSSLSLARCMCGLRPDGTPSSGSTSRTCPRPASPPPHARTARASTPSATTAPPGPTPGVVIAPAGQPPSLARLAAPTASPTRSLTVAAFPASHVQLDSTPYRDSRVPLPGPAPQARERTRSAAGIR